MTRPSVRVRFVDADRGHEAKDSFLVGLTQHVSGRPIVIVPERKAYVDIEFASVQYPIATKLRAQGQRALQRRLPKLRSRDSRWVHHNPSPSGNARSHIWFSGENVRPPVGKWTGYLSFDLDPLGGKNAYCPLWWWGIGLVGAAHSPFISPAPDLQTLMQPRRPNTKRHGFVAAFINNPHPMRMHAIEALQGVGKVDVYGQAVGRPVGSKFDVAKNYKFVLCFENDFYPGYVTEKPIEAWACGAVPIWWGSDPAGYLNKDALVNSADFSGLSDMAEHVRRISDDREAWSRMAGLPLVVREPDLKPAISVISRALGEE